MKKSILNLGKALNKGEQKQIQGGKKQCDADHLCSWPNEYCFSGYCLMSLPSI